MSYFPYVLGPDYINQLKEECTPHFKLGNEACGKPAPPWIDNWGDRCGGEICRREKEHDGSHMAFDGANGYHYF